MKLVFDLTPFADLEASVEMIQVADGWRVTTTVQHGQAHTFAHTFTRPRGGSGRRAVGVTPAVQAAALTEATEGQVNAVDWRQLPRTQAVERVLNESSPVGPARIHQVLLERGRDDDAHSIHAALGHLKLKHRATQVSRGLWVPLNKANGEVS
jgi:hypothetical protein